MKYAKWQWQKWARVVTPQGGVARGWAAPPGGEAALWPLSSPPSGYFSVLAKYNFLLFFWNFLIFRNMVS
jgi:hypothetical protein